MLVKIAIISCVLTIVVLLILRLLKSQGPIEMDKEKLAQAREDMNQQIKDHKMVNLKMSSSSEGVRMEDIINWVSYLNQNGFYATYDVFEGGGIFNYIVKVDESQRDQAETLLEEYISSSQ